MVRSLGLMMLIVVGVLLLGPGRRLVFPGDQAHPVPHASYGPHVRAAVQLSRHAFLAPSGLPKGWQATSARNSTAASPPATLHVGFLTSAHRYAGLEESTGDPRPFLERHLGSELAAHPPTVVVGGERWQRRTDSRGESALVRSAGGLTTIAVGNATRSELRTLAASLHPVAPPSS
jgi:hypothetical protein